MTKRPPEVFNSDLHLPKWRQAVLWLLESGPGRTSISLFAAAILGIPLIFAGWWWAAVVTALLVGFVCGYWVARSYWRSGQDIPPL